MIVIRSCLRDGRSHGGFAWPLEVGATVEAPDWDPTPECENGLDGLRPGDNAPGEWYDGVYLALEVDADDVVDLRGKCKFRRATILHIAPDMGALSQWLSANGHPGPWYRGIASAGNEGAASAGDGGIASAGDGGTASAGDGGTASAGDGGIASTGDMGTASAGDGGIASTGDGGKASTGDGGIASAGYGGKASTGDGGIASAGNRGKASAGDRGTATAGTMGIATAGDWGTATAGYRGTATAGYGGVIIIRDSSGVLHVGHIGENGLTPNVRYRLNDSGEWEEVTA